MLISMNYKIRIHTCQAILFQREPRQTCCLPRLHFSFDRHRDLEKDGQHEEAQGVDAQGDHPLHQGRDVLVHLVQRVRHEAAGDHAQALSDEVAKRGHRVGEVDRRRLPAFWNRGEGSLGADEAAKYCHDF